MLDASAIASRMPTPTVAVMAAARRAAFAARPVLSDRSTSESGSHT